MYAVIETGGKQHRVELGSQIQVDRLDARAGDPITLDRVLLVADGDEAAIGQPLVAGATVLAEVVAQGRGRKVVVFKYKPKARTRVKRGFRAELTTLRITDIAFGGKSAATAADQARKDADRKARQAAKAERAAAEKAAAEKAAADKELAARLAAGEDQRTAKGSKGKAEAKRKPQATGPTGKPQATGAEGDAEASEAAGPELTAAADEAQAETDDSRKDA